MKQRVIDLSRAGHGTFLRVKPKWLEALWILAEFLFVTNPLQLSSTLRTWVLRRFGARIGQGVIMRPRVRIKFPWNLEVGDRCWIGEGVWIHNQDKVVIASDVVISQETFITTGSHDIYTTMDLEVAPVHIEAGVWVTSRCMILKGVTLATNAVILPGSVVNKSLAANALYGGNPAKFIKVRFPDA